MNAVFPGLIKTNLTKESFETIPGFLDNYLSVLPMKKLAGMKDVFKT